MAVDIVWIAHLAIVLLFLSSGLVVSLGLALLTVTPWYVVLGPALLGFIAGHAAAISLLAD